MNKLEKNEKKKNTPAFLRNTYQMLEVCFISISVNS